MAAKLLAALIASLFVASAFGDRVTPCTNLTSTCVGRFIAGNSECSRAALTPEKLDPLTIDKSPIDVSFFNASGSFNNASIIGLSNYTMKTFFYNKTSQQGVLTVNFPAFSIEGDLVLDVLAINREIVTIKIHYTLFYTDVTITTVVRDYTNIDLSTTVSIAYLPTPPTNSFGDGFAPEVLALAATYPEVKDLVNQRKLHPDVFAVESFKNRASSIAQAHINYALCSFS